MPEIDPLPGNNHPAVRQSLVARLRNQGVEIGYLTKGLDNNALSRRVLTDKWSLKELVCHLWRVQHLFDDRIEAMLTKKDPVLLPYTPDSDTDFDKLVSHDATETREAFLGDRINFTSRLEQLSSSQWHRTGQHPEYSRFDVHFQVEYMVHHEAHHIYQLFQRRLQVETPER